VFFFAYDCVQVYMIGFFLFSPLLEDMMALGGQLLGLKVCWPPLSCPLDFLSRFFFFFFCPLFSLSFFIFAEVVFKPAHLDHFCRLAVLLSFNWFPWTSASVSISYTLCNDAVDWFKMVSFSPSI